MPQISLDLPTHLIDVPAGRSSERYYIPIYNIPFGGARELISYWLQDCGVIDWQFHNDARSGWICFEYERDFGIALEILQEAKQLHPKLEYSAVNKLRSIKLEVIDCTLTQPRFARIYSSHVKGSLRRWDDLIDWIRLDLPKAKVDRMQKILLTGLSSRPNIHELNRWMCSKLGSDCLLIVASRIARIGMCRALVFVCTLAMVKGLSEDRIYNCLEGVMFGNETVRILVERSDGQASATECQQEAAPLVVLGSSRLPPHWPSIVSKWNHSMEKIDEDTT